MSSCHRLGKLGESVALALLEACGYVCLARRYRRPGGEIDLIMRRRDALVFVEVKTRSGYALAPAEAALNKRQIGHLRRTALRWLSENPGERGAPRFDLVAVEFHGRQEGSSLRHYIGIG